MAGTQRSIKSLPFQLKVLAGSQESLFESLVYCNSYTDSYINIADYGSSNGYNSLYLFYHTYKKFRETSPKIINVTHNDKPENNWNMLYSTINSSEFSYHSLSHAYYNTIGRSFYSQIFPPNWIHIAYSASAIHYLSKPLFAPDHIFPSSSNNCDFKEKASMQAHEDITLFLNTRYRELNDYGRVILVFVSKSIENGSCAAVNYAINNLYIKNIINEEEKRKFGINIYGRTQQEVNKVINDVKGLFKAVNIDLISVLEYEYEDANKEEQMKYKRNIVNGFKGFLDGILNNALVRPDEEKEIIKELFYNEIENSLTDEIMKTPTAFHLLVLEKIPRNI